MRPKSGAGQKTAVYEMKRAGSISRPFFIQSLSAFTTEGPFLLPFSCHKARKPYVTRKFTCHIATMYIMKQNITLRLDKDIIKINSSPELHFGQQNAEQPTQADNRQGRAVRSWQAKRLACFKEGIQFGRKDNLEARRSL